MCPNHARAAAGPAGQHVLGHRSQRRLSTDDKAAILLEQGKIPEGMLRAWRGHSDEQFARLIDSRFESQLLKAGIVWTDAELRSQFKLSDEQVALYHEFRAATDRSLDTMARADMLRYAGDDAKELRDRVMDARDVRAAAVILRDHLAEMADARPDRAKHLMELAHGVMDRAEKVTQLQAEGYAPLSRFGKYTVDVVDQAGERQYFGLFETRREANQMAEQMRGAFPDAAVNQGTLSEESYKLFAGITPETLELFGNALGFDSQGVSERDQAFQEYLRLTKTNRSAMRRLIHRKGIAGYSEDVGRVLASFIYSNGRQTAAGLHMGDLSEAVDAIPKEQGELKDAAVRLADYIKNPQEEAQAIRGLLFAQYLGGSVASALVNMTQPAAVTFPWLSQFGGARKAAAELGRAARQMATKGFQYEADLARALHDAEEDGTVSPQEVHQLMAQARGSGSLRAGDGTRLGDARALGSNSLSRLSVAWGKLFGAAEQVNRRVTFIAAYRMAKARDMADPAAFARRAVTETQFVYCVDSQTECLTTEGWKTRDQLRPGNTIIGIAEDGSAVHTVLKAVHVFPGRQAINSFSGSRKFNMMVTDGHDCLVQHFDNRLKKWSRVLKRRAVDLRPGHQLLRSPTKSVERAPWIGDDMAALLGWVASEGNYAKFRNCVNRTNVRITQSASHNPAYVEEIEALLTRLGGHYRKFLHKGGTMATFTLRKPLSDEVRRLMPVKLLTWELAEHMPHSEMRATIDAFAKGDGHLLAEGGWLIAQKVEQNLHVLQAMAVLTGQNATLYPKRGDSPSSVSQLYLHVNSQRSQVANLKQEVVYVDDGVWCPETECGTWMARRNGAVFATGNSKASKMQWGRGAVGGTLLTFKTYSIAYLELMSRLWSQGEAGSQERKDGRKAALLMLATLMLLGGAGGLPFAEDADDVVDAMAQIAGYNFSAKKAKQEFLESVFG